MKTYIVRIKYNYSGEVEVEASSKEEAEDLALLEDCEEQCDSIQEVIVTEI